MFEIKDEVIKLMQKRPDLRDDDNRLAAVIWWEECKRLGRPMDKMTAADFMQIMIDGKVSSLESIGRARRKVEEEHPELRGATYEQRQRLQKKAQADLGYPVKDELFENDSTKTYGR